MRWLLAVLVLAGASVKAQTITQTFGTGANQFSIDFVEIGNPGNPADTTGSPNPAGSVGYVYNIGKYEVSRDMITKANAAGGLGIDLFDLTSYGGNGINRPASGVSWNEAARFVNWLNTSKGYQAAYNFNTSGANNGVSVWGEGQYSGNNQFRHKDAYYFLPNTDEWYKAAYYDPNKPGGAGYWNYATGSDSPPTAVANGTSGAVYNAQSGPADITNAGGLSPYGTMAQEGNVWEWSENVYVAVYIYGALEARELRGGSWFYGGDGLSAGTLGLGASSRTDTVIGPPYGDYSNGFRVASVPEPSSLSLLFCAGGAVLMAGRRRKQN